MWCGKKESDNGLVIVIAVDDQEWFFATGYGIKEFFPDALMKRIAEKNFPPFFREGNYFQGILGALEDIETILLTGEVFFAEENNELSLGQIFFFLAPFFFFFHLVDFGAKNGIQEFLKKMITDGDIVSFPKDEKQTKSPHFLTSLRERYPELFPKPESPSGSDSGEFRGKW